MDSETLEIIRTFVAESLDSLDEQEEKIQYLSGSGSKESINSIFRAFHTIKGLSGFLSFNVINTITQEVEVLLDFLRKNPKVLSETVIALIGESFSLLRTLLQTVREAAKDIGHEEAVRNHISRLKQAVILMKSDADAGIASPSSTSSAASFSPVSQSSNNITPRLNASETKEYPSQVQKASTQPSQAPVMAASDVQLNTVVAVTTTTTIGLNTVVSSDRQDKSRDIASRGIAVDEKTLSTEAVASNTANAAISNDHLQCFIPESLEFVSMIEQGCKRLEQNPHDMTVIGAMLTTVLRLKENAAFIGFAEMERKSADVEDILEAVRNKVLKVYPGLISMLLSTVLSMRMFIQDIALGQVAKAQKDSDGTTLSASPPFSGMTVSGSTSHLPPMFGLSSENVLSTRREVLVDADIVQRLCSLVNELVAIEPIFTNEFGIAEVNAPGFKNAAETLHKITHELHDTAKSLGDILNTDRTHPLK